MSSPKKNRATTTKPCKNGLRPSNNGTAMKVGRELSTSQTARESNIDPNKSFARRKPTKNHHSVRSVKGIEKARGKRKKIQLRRDKDLNNVFITPPLIISNLWVTTQQVYFFYH